MLIAILRVYYIILCKYFQSCATKKGKASDLHREQELLEDYSSFLDYYYLP